jgi:hypothetical protein
MYLGCKFISMAAEMSVGGIIVLGEKSAPCNANNVTLMKTYNRSTGCLNTIPNNDNYDCPKEW